MYVFPASFRTSDSPSWRTHGPRSRNSVLGTRLSEIGSPAPPPSTLTLLQHPPEQHRPSEPRPRSLQSTVARTTAPLCSSAIPLVDPSVYVHVTSGDTSMHLPLQILSSSDARKLTPRSVLPSPVASCMRPPVLATPRVASNATKVRTVVLESQLSTSLPVPSAKSSCNNPSSGARTLGHNTARARISISEAGVVQERISPGTYLSMYLPKSRVSTHRGEQGSHPADGSPGEARRGEARRNALPRTVTVSWTRADQYRS
ncbi:hypothetical protein C8T65DRAFT_289522 [Cerioporus squamosus]|nr:hypothetical protein C8T65DRAFT_289522 [Cerioporus squamosus]